MGLISVAGRYSTISPVEKRSRKGKQRKGGVGDGRGKWVVAKEGGRGRRECKKEAGQINTRGYDYSDKP